MIEYLYPNQYAIKTRKSLSNASHPYTVLNLKAMKRAMKRLSPSAFKLWCYLNKNLDGYEYGLSKADATSYCNMCITTYEKAMKQLKEKGYLVPYTFPDRIKGWMFLEDADKTEV